jgi:predicted RNA binding protein YcfA (HicA-like mRNA interferase family)
MPKIPRDLNSKVLCQSLQQYGYQITRQTGSHIRLTRSRKDEEHHITIPAHDQIKIGTLNKIFNDLCRHLNLDKETLLKNLFG